MPKFSFNHCISHDCDLAEIYFNDFKQGSMNDNVNLFFGSCQTDYLVIFENDKVLNESYYKKSKLARMNKDELYGLNYYHDLVWRLMNLIYMISITSMLTLTMIKIS